MTLAIVIVNYRTAGLAIDSMRSLPEGLGSPAGSRLVVVDNASGDGSAERIRDAIRAEGWDGWASVRALDHNGGFAAGNNAAIREILSAEQPPAYLLLLNPDTVVRPGAIAALVAFMQDHREVGIAGSRLEDPDGTPQWSAFQFHSICSEFEANSRVFLLSRLLWRRDVAMPDPEKAGRVDWVAGASMIVRREVFDAIGLLDEDYFLYFEEVDFCLRARRAGWPCWYVPESRVVHLVGQASGVTDPRRARRRRPAYWFDSRRRYFVKNHGAFYGVLADAAWALGLGVGRVRRWLRGQESDDPDRLLRDFLRHSTLARGLRP